MSCPYCGAKEFRRNNLTIIYDCKTYIFTDGEVYRSGACKDHQIAQVENLFKFVQRNGCTIQPSEGVYECIGEEIYGSAVNVEDAIRQAMEES